MHKFLRIIQNRNLILLSALFFAFQAPEFSTYTKEYTIFILGAVMTFSMTGIHLKLLKDYKSTLKVTFEAVLYSFILQAVLLLGIAYFATDDAVFNGFTVIAATPPGVAVIPFSFSFKGDLDYSFRAILGTYLISIFLSPLIIYLFAKGAFLDPTIIVMIIVKVIVVPLLLSRLLLIKKIYPYVEKVRGKVVDWGFALIIYTAVAVNRGLILSDFSGVLLISAIIFLSTFGIGALFLFLNRKNENKKQIISKNLLLTVKSSGFSIAVTLILFEQKAAVSAAILSIFVLLWLISLNIYYSRRNKKDKKLAL